MNAQDVANLVNEALVGVRTNRPARRPAAKPSPTSAAERKVRALTLKGAFDGEAGDAAWARHLADQFHAGEIPATETLERVCLAQGIDIVSEALAAAPVVVEVTPEVEAPAPAPVVVEIADVPAVTGATAGLYDGTYTVAGPQGHRTLRVRTQATDSSFQPGKQLVGLLTGSDNEGDYTNFGSVELDEEGLTFIKVWGRHQGTQTEKIGNSLLSLLTQDVLGRKLSRAGYSVVVAARCYRCHRVLTVPTSVHQGYGPECINHI